MTAAGVYPESDLNRLRVPQLRAHPGFNPVLGDVQPIFHDAVGDWRMYMQVRSASLKPTAPPPKQEPLRG